MLGMRQHTSRSFFGAIVLSVVTLFAPLAVLAACPIGTPGSFLSASDICDAYSTYLAGKCCPSHDLAGNCIAMPGLSPECTKPTWNGLYTAAIAGSLTVVPPADYSSCAYFNDCNNGSSDTDSCKGYEAIHAAYCTSGSLDACTKAPSTCPNSKATSTTAAYTPGSSWTLSNPLGTTDIPTILGRLIQTFLGLVGAISLLVFVYAGVMYMTSAGGEKGIKTAKDTMAYAAIGLAIIIFAYAIATNYFNILTGSH